MMGRVQKQFSAAAKPKCSHHSKNFLPANDFEAHTGLFGISAHYIFPRGLSAAKYSDYVSYSSRAFDYYTFSRTDYTFAKKSDSDPVFMQQMRKDWDELVALNPELKKVSLNREEALDLQSALAGAVSQFNVDDLNAFIDIHHKTGRVSAAIDIPKLYGLEDIERGIELTTGVQMSWVASPRTVRK